MNELSPSINIVEAIHTWAIADFYITNESVDIYISTTPPPITVKQKNKSVVFLTYKELKRDFTTSWPLAQLLLSNKRLVCIVDTFSVKHYKELIEYIANRDSTTHIININAWRSWLITLWEPEDMDIKLRMEKGISVYEPATYKMMLAYTKQQKKQYIRISIFPIPTELTEWKNDNNDIVLWCNDTLVDPQSVLLVTGNLLYEWTIMQTQLTNAWIPTELYIRQSLTRPKLPETFLYACNAAQRCIILVDQSISWLDTYLQHLLPKDLAWIVEIRILKPKYSSITTHYEESIQEQTEWEWELES
jgi:hypothetical protein